MLTALLTKAAQSGDYFGQWIRLGGYTERALWIAQQDPGFLKGLDEQFGKSWVWSDRARLHAPVGLLAAGGAAWIVLMAMGVPLLQASPIAVVGAVGALSLRQALIWRAQFRDLCSPAGSEQLAEVLRWAEEYDAVRAAHRSLRERGHEHLRVAHVALLQKALEDGRRAGLQKKLEETAGN